MTHQTIVNAVDVMQWATRINEIRKQTPGQVDASEKCVTLAKKLMEKDGEFANLHFSSILTQADDQPLPSQSPSSAAGDPAEIKRPIKEIKIGPQMEVTAFRLMFGWGKAAVSGIIDVDGKPIAALGDPFTAYDLTGIPRGELVPWASTLDMVLIRVAKDGKSVERHLVSASTTEWTTGVLGTDMLQHKTSEDGSQLCIRLTEPDEHFIEKWVVRMGHEAAGQVCDALLLQQQQKNGGAGVATTGGVKEEEADNKQ